MNGRRYLQIIYPISISKYIKNSYSSITTKKIQFKNGQRIWIDIFPKTYRWPGDRIYILYIQNMLCKYNIYTYTINYTSIKKKKSVPGITQGIRLEGGKEEKNEEFGKGKSSKTGNQMEECGTSNNKTHSPPHPTPACQCPNRWQASKGNGYWCT